MIIWRSTETGFKITTKRPKPTSKATKTNEPRRRLLDGVEWELIQPGSIVVRVPYEQNATWQQSFLLSSDRHWDNPHSDHEMQIRHLSEMIERNAFCLDNGDLFCAMQGKYDKRSSKSDLREEHKTGRYLDSLTETADVFFSPWANRFIMIGKGNHEESISNNHETCLTERLISLLNQRGGSVINGGFGGFVKFSFRVNSPGGAGSYRDVVLHYDHGYGGGGPVTRDMIQHQRRQVYLPDADIIMSGHTHDQWSYWCSRVRLNQVGKIHHDEVLHVKTPTYKEEYGTGSGGWHSRRGSPPKPIGAYWLNFKYRNNRIVFDVERAV